MSDYGGMVVDQRMRDIHVTQHRSQGAKQAVDLNPG